jgi:hypothetical protein
MVGGPLCQRSWCPDRIGTFGGAGRRKWLDTDKVQGSDSVAAVAAGVRRSRGPAWRQRRHPDDALAGLEPLLSERLDEMALAADPAQRRTGIAASISVSSATGRPG